MAGDDLGFWSVVGHGMTGRPPRNRPAPLSCEDLTRLWKKKGEEAQRHAAWEIPRTFTAAKAGGNNCTLPDTDLFRLLAAWENADPRRLEGNTFYNAKDQDPVQMKKEAGGRLFLGLMDRGHFDFWIKGTKREASHTPTFRECITTVPEPGNRPQYLQQQINRVSFRLRNQWPFSTASMSKRMPNERAHDIISLAEFFGVQDIQPAPVIDPPRHDWW